MKAWYAYYAVPGLSGALFSRLHEASYLPMYQDGAPVSETNVRRWLSSELRLYRLPEGVAILTGDEPPETLLFTSLAALQYVPACQVEPAAAVSGV